MKTNPENMADMSAQYSMFSPQPCEWVVQTQAPFRAVLKKYNAQVAEVWEKDGLFLSHYTGGGRNIIAKFQTRTDAQQFLEKRYAQ